MANSKDQKQGNPLDDELAKGEDILRKNDDFRKDMIHHLLMYKIGDRITDQRAALYEAMEQKKGDKGIINILVDETVRAIDGLIVVPEFHEKKSSEQDVLIYIGTHWVKFSVQSFHDNLRQWAEKMGLGHNKIIDDGFMMKYYRCTLFNLKNNLIMAERPYQTSLNLINGTLTIDEDGNICFRDHDKNDFFQYVIPYAYDPNASCMVFEQYLEEVLPEKDVREVVQEFFGYCLSKRLRLERFLVLWGIGGNGKSILMEALAAMLGSKNVSNVMLSDFDNDQKRAAMEGKYVNISRETGKKFPSEIIKTMTSGEPVMVKHLYKNPREITNYGKLVASFNIMPPAENTWAFRRRMLKIDFNVTISKEKDDKNLSKKICENECAGILNWALEGLKRLIKNGDFSDSQTIAASVEAYMNEADNFKMFTLHCCEKDDDTKTKGKNIHQAYLNYCLLERISQDKILGRQKLYDRLSAMYSHTEYQNVKYFGLKLKIND